MPRNLLPLVLIAFAITANAFDVAAQSLFTLEQLTDASAVVVAGTVTSVHGQWDPAVNGIYTYARIEVSEVWKGELPAKPIVIKILGGRVGDIELAINGQARVEPGKQVALWLEVRPRDRTLYPAGLAQGVRELTDASVVETLRTLVQNRAGAAATQTFEAVPREWQPEIASSFTFLPSDLEGGPARWHEADSDTRVPVDYETPSGFGGGVAEIDGAIVLWNNSGSRLRMERANPRAARCLATYENGGDGRITLSFSDPCGEVADNSPTFGVGGGYFTSGELRTVSGVEFKKFLQGVAMLNPAANQPALGQRGCFQDAIAHNLGHTFGLGDSNVASALMSATFGSRCSATPSTLAQDDRDGARAVYPAPPSAPLNLTGNASGTTVTLSWTAPVSGPVTTYVIEAGTTPGQPTIVTATGPATGVTFTGVPPGFYYIRVRAQNSVGTGPPSNEIGLAVACLAPQPPTNLSFSALLNNVTLTWNAPASGPAPTAYLLVVGSSPGAGNLLAYQFPPATSLSASAPSGTYFARLHSLGACGTSAASNEVTITLPAPCVAPSAPQGFTHSVGANRVVSLSWSAPAAGSAPFTYTIEVGSQSGSSNLLVVPLGGVTSVVTQAPPGTYFVRIRATNACGTQGVPSAERTVVVP